MGGQPGCQHRFPASWTRRCASPSDRPCPSADRVTADSSTQLGACPGKNWGLRCSNGRANGKGRAAAARRCAGPLPSPLGEGGTASAVSDEVFLCRFPLIRLGARDAALGRGHLAHQGTFSPGRRQKGVPSPRTISQSLPPFRISLFQGFSPPGLHQFPVLSPGQAPKGVCESAVTLSAGGHSPSME